MNNKQAPRVVMSSAAPAAVGPYSQGVIANGMVFTAGQIAIDPATGNMVANDITAQTRQVIANLSAILQEAGASLRTVVKTTVFLSDMNNFTAMNDEYALHFPTNPPARSTVQAARLPKDAMIEIEAVAILDTL